MTTAQPTTQAAVSAADAKRLRLAALLDLAREHDDDVNYAEVEQLLASARPRLVLRETSSLARAPRRTRCNDRSRS